MPLNYAELITHCEVKRKICRKRPADGSGPGKWADNGRLRRKVGTSKAPEAGRVSHSFAAKSYGLNPTLCQSLADSNRRPCVTTYLIVRMLLMFSSGFASSTITSARFPASIDPTS